jgi:hypothetical protein
VVEVLNLYLVIMQSQNPNFTGVESQGEAIVSIIIVNISVNMLAALIGVIHDIYQHGMKRKRGNKGTQNTIENMRKREQLQNNRLKPKEEGQSFELQMLRRTQQSPLKESNHYNDDSARNSFINLQEREDQQLSFTVESPELRNKPKSRKIMVEKELLVENAGDIKLASRARSKTNPIQTKRDLPVNQRETKPNVQGFMIDLENELNNRKIQRIVSFKKEVEQPKIDSNSKAPINSLAVNSPTQRREKTNLARHRQTEVKLNEPKPTTLNLDGHVENEMKIVERHRAQTQTGQSKKRNRNLDTHMDSNIKNTEYRRIRGHSNQLNHSKIILETQMREIGNSQRAQRQKNQSILTLTNLDVQFEEEKKQTVECCQTQGQLKKPKISVFDANINIKDDVKVAERDKTQAQLTQPKINFAMDISTQKKEIAKPFTDDSRSPLPLKKPSQFADPNENPFIRFEGRRRTRALQPGYLMQ